MRTVVFYRDANGNNPIEEFLDGLPAKGAQKATWILRLIEDLEVLPKTYFKKLVNTDEIWEAGTRLGSNSYRWLCFLYESDLVVLTNGFRKKTQKTPRNEIDIAETRKRDWLRRRG